MKIDPGKLGTTDDHQLAPLRRWIADNLEEAHAALVAIERRRGSATLAELKHAQRLMREIISLSQFIGR